MKKLYITEEQKYMVEQLINDCSSKMLLNEENRTQKKKCEENITNNIHPYFRRFLNTPLRDLNSDLVRLLNPEGQLFQQTLNAPEGVNKFIDYLRHNLYAQFGIKRGNSLVTYIPGISRIACADLRFYSMDLSVRGGDVIRFTRLLKLIDKKPEMMLDGVSLDANFNGMSYEEMIEIFNDKIKKYKEQVMDNLENHEDYKITRTPEYTIVEVPDTIVQGYGGYIARPTPEGRALLNRLGRYTDWCICSNAHADEEYSQYLSSGGKAYICMKNGFESIPRPENVETALDEYGLSLICVIVGSDGLPDNVTTRYNHDFDGENHGDFWEATHLQKVLQVKYTSVFKPRPEAQVRRMLRMNEGKALTAQDQVNKKVNAGIMDAVTGGGMMEGAEPESNKYTIGSEGGNNDYFHVVNEMKDDELDIRKNIDSIANFMKEEGLKVYPFPEVELNNDDQDGLFITTGYYLPEEKKVVLFCKDRHPKDILRSYAHEMIHHKQNLEGKNLNFSSADDVKDNKELEKLEAEAYLEGNIFFRKWTEYERSKKDKKQLNESPDHIETVGLSYNDKCGHPFILFNGFENEPIYALVGGETHSDIAGRLYDDAYDGEDYFGISDEFRKAILSKQLRPLMINSYYLQGRYYEPIEDFPWGGNIISLYDYSLSSVKRDYSKLMNMLNQMKSDGLNVDFDTLDFDHWNGEFASRFPFAWIANGLAESLLGYAYKITKNYRGTKPCYNVYADNGRIVPFSADGKVLETANSYLAESFFVKSVDESLSPQEVDLTSFNVQKNLNPKFWKNDKLDSRIRIKLLDIADDFIEFLGVNWVKPEDVIITGSLANYNWNKKYSDIDLHILMDFSKVDKRKDFVRKYFKAQKELWNEKHEELRIYGFPIEVYVQDINEKHNSSGVYSLETNEWITEPDKSKISTDGINRNKIKREVSKYTEKIDSLEKRSNSMKGDEYKSRKVMEDAEKLFQEIKDVRKKSLSNKDSELSDGNLIFKCLRRLGYLDKLYNIIDKGYNAFNSLP